MKFFVTLLLGLALASTAFAGPPSTIGGARLGSDMAHQVRSGWLSTSYEWWNTGKRRLDWALGGELVYGPWSGERRKNKRNADQLGMEVIGMLWEVGVERFC